MLGVPVKKEVASAATAVADIPNGATLAVGGFVLVGVPVTLIRALLAQGASNLEVVSNNCGVDGWLVILPILSTSMLEPSCIGRGR